jgi:hypothetical protein
LPRLTGKISKFSCAKKLDIDRERMVLLYAELVGGDALPGDIFHI